MDAKLINPFLNAAVNVLSTMASTTPKAGTPYIKEHTLTFGEVTGVVGLSGEGVDGNMIVSFSKDAILKIVSRMLAEEFTTVSQSVVDAVGELTNMICGGAKTGLSEHGIKLGMASPVMIVGSNVEMSILSKSPTIVIPFSTDAGPFVVEANLSKK